MVSSFYKVFKKNSIIPLTRQGTGKTVTAVNIGELVPIRCIRVKTNVDISNVRINGIKYNTQDLESKLFVPERNKLIIDTYLDFVRDKKTVIFCASVKHAEDIANLFKENGIIAEAVSGKMNNKNRKEA